MRATTEQYLTLLQNLLPTGAAWSREPDSTLTQVLTVIAGAMAKAHNRAADLLDELDPRTTLELLTDWERVCDLPDSGAALGETIAARRGAVVARLTATGGQNAAYFVALAASLGFEVEIIEYRMRLHGRRRHGTRYGGREMQFVWAVRPVNGTFRRPRRLRRGYHGEAYSLWQFAELVALFQKLKPAHSTVLFQ